MWYNAFVVAVLRSPLHGLLSRDMLLLSSTGRTRRIWAGERNNELLTTGIDPNSAALVRRILRFVEDGPEMIFVSGTQQLAASRRRAEQFTLQALASSRVLPNMGAVWSAWWPGSWSACRRRSPSTTEGSTNSFTNSCTVCRRFVTSLTSSSYGTSQLPTASRNAWRDRSRVSPVTGRKPPARATPSTLSRAKERKPATCGSAASDPAST
jgi:hypothetical protein